MKKRWLSILLLFIFALVLMPAQNAYTTELTESRRSEVETAEMPASNTTLFNNTIHENLNLMLPHAATGWTLIKFPTAQPGCTGVGFNGPVYYDRLDCGFGYVVVSETVDGDTVKVDFIHAETDTPYETGQVTTWRADDTAWEFDIQPGAAWPPGEYFIRVSEVNGTADNFGQTSFFLNYLGAVVSGPAGGTNYSPGDAFNVTGVVNKVDGVAADTVTETPVTGTPATFSMRVVQPDGTAVYTTTGETTSTLDGSFSVSVPAGTTSGVQPGVDEGFMRNLSIQVYDVTWNDVATGDWGSTGNAGTTNINIVVEPTVGDVGSVSLQTSFVSSVGWVKPDETYPFSVIVRNFSADPVSNAQVTIADIDGSNYTNILTPPVGTTASISTVGDTSSVTWDIPTMPANSILTLVVQAKADSLTEDPTIVWKDISSSASLDYDGAMPADPNLASIAHGPKVIPESSAYNSTRYGDRPFPVVQVDWLDRKHQPENTGALLSDKVNSPNIIGSTFNLFQENSFGQLFPEGTHPSSDIAQAGFDVDWNGYYDTAGNGSPGSGDGQFFFTQIDAQGTCSGVTNSVLAGTAAYPDRIIDGRYQMPGTTGYYGQDKFGSAVAGAVAGVGPLLAIDDACGPTGKAVYDAAHIADPEIDYNDYDTDKDGIVDFFMMMFVGCGGNGASQLSVAGCNIGNGEPYDNIWPHSSSLLFYYTDAATGLTGYISDDQLKSLTDVPQCWLDNTYALSDDCAANGGTGDDTLPVYVRVGPYNVNPETAIENASVISHEYGHSLGLPDFYSLGGRETYGSWNLMASDHSQNMDVFGKQEMGWIVPVPLSPNENLTVDDWRDSKFDTGEIHWETPAGVPYTLSAANGNQNIHNGEAYNVKLPTPLLLDPSLVITPAAGFEGASAPTVWWSGAGNDFGCAPATGHNLDIFLPNLADVTLGAGQSVIVEFKSLWNIEWDYDYGFVMYTTDGDQYTAMPSMNSYTTPAAQNPNANGCQTTFGNGLTGTSSSYQAGTAAVDRVAGNYDYTGGFLADRYDMSDAAGSDTAVLRFSYSTDPGFTAPGWFIDDVVVKIEEAGQDDVILYQSNFDDENEGPVFNGGCKSETCVAGAPTAGWNFVSIEAGSPADKGYYLEMRDRSGFDFDGNDENDRGPLDWTPGLYVMFTDEVHGYGNTGADNQPAQSPVDANPTVGSESPALGDAAFTDGGVSTYSDKGAGWTDNYDDGSGSWIHAFDCLEFTINSMSGEETAGAGTGGSNAVPGDLVGNVTFNMGDGCAEFSNPVCQLPVAVIDVNITELPSEEVQLSWTATSDAYEVWWEVDNPYFTPGMDCASASNCDMVAGTTYTHMTGGVGDPAGNYYYIVVGSNACGQQSGVFADNHTAEFDFVIVPGTN